MAYFPIVGDIIQFKTFCWLPNQLGINSYHFRVRSVVGLGADMDAITIQFDTGVAVPLKAAISSSATYIGVTGQKVFPLPKPDASIIVTSAGIGALGGDLMPTNVSGITTKRTGFAGRALRGRVYLPFPTESVNDANGNPTVAYLGIMGTLATKTMQFFTAGLLGNTTTLDPVVFHVHSGTFNYITSFTAQSRWGSQHRRGPYGKLNLRPF